MVSQKVITKQIVGGVITAFLATILIGLATAAINSIDKGWLAELIGAAKQSDIDAVAQSGAVMAFNKKICPDGWREFTLARGRVVLGTNPPIENGLSRRSLGDLGGEETHTLTMQEMPRHTPSYTFTDHHGTPDSTDYSNWEFGNANTSRNTSSAGENSPHNNMPPFVALLYCTRG